MPGSPTRLTTCPWPSSARRIRASKVASSNARPTRGLSGRAPWVRRCAWRGPKPSTWYVMYGVAWPGRGTGGSTARRTEPRTSRAVAELTRIVPGVACRASLAGRRVVSPTAVTLYAGRRPDCRSPPGLYATLCAQHLPLLAAMPGSGVLPADAGGTRAPPTRRAGRDFLRHRRAK